MTQKQKFSRKLTETKKTLEGEKPEGNKRALKDFLANEEGFVSKETILKVGLATISGVSMMAGMAAAQTACNGLRPGELGHCNSPKAHCSHTSHENNFGTPDNGSSECPMFQPQHAHENAHNSHCSY